MSLFIRHVKYYEEGRLDEKAITVIGFIVDFFSAAPLDEFYIMDPYLDPVEEIQKPFSEEKAENEIWSNLLAELAISGACVFKIITTREFTNELRTKTNPPYDIPFLYPDQDVTIEACKYIETKYCELSLHDRYILKKNGTECIGLHIGPSLSGIVNKDVSITLYDAEGAAAALESFIDIWEQCKKNKEWKTN